MSFDISNSPAPTDDDVFESVMAALTSLASMPARWLQLASTATAVSAEEIANELGPNASKIAERKLQNFRAQLKAANGARQHQVDSAARRLRAAQTEIARIEKLYPPGKPRYYRAMDSEQFRAYERQMVQYRAELEEVNKSRAALPQIREQAAQAERELSENLAELKGDRANGKAEERNFQRDLDEARDLDILDGMRRVVDEALTSLGSPTDATRGFITLLVVGCLVERIKRAVSQVATVTAIGGLIDRAMEALRGALVGDTGLAIAGNVLRAPQIVWNVAGRNGESFKNLQQLLSGVDLEAVRTLHRPLRELLDAPESQIPPYSHLELPSEVEKAKVTLVGMRDLTVRRIAELRRVMEEPFTPLAQNLERVERDGRKILEQMLRRADEGSAPLAVAERTSALLQKAESSGSVHHSIYEFSKALMDEWKKRFGDAVKKASESRFEHRSAEEQFEGHESTLYLEDRGRLPEKLRANEDLLVQEEEALRYLDGAVERTAAEFKRELVASAFWALVPLIGIFLSLRVTGRLRRLKPLVASGHKAYVDVGALAPRVLARSAVLSLAIAAALVWMAAKGPLAAMEISGGALAGLGVVGFFLSARNVWLARSLAP
jgi:hypothetical protein